MHEPWLWTLVCGIILKVQYSYTILLYIIIIMLTDLICCRLRQLGTTINYILFKHFYFLTIYLAFHNCFILPPWTCSMAQKIALSKSFPMSYRKVPSCLVRDLTTFIVPWLITDHHLTCNLRLCHLPEKNLVWGGEKKILGKNVNFWIPGWSRDVDDIIKIS